MRVTLSTLKTMRNNGEKIAVLTCYDASFTRVLDAAGVDVLLVGDSLGMVVQGHQSTLPVKLAEMSAAVYRRRFRKGQKCWAHLLRKAIRLALLYPRKQAYRRFLDELLSLYYEAKRAAADQRLGPSGRARRVKEFSDGVNEFFRRYWRLKPDMKPHERDFANLVNELFERMLDEELFTFVLNPEVDRTNDLPERLQRSPAQDRNASRTNKTAAGAHRRSVIVSVLESLRTNLPALTLAGVLEEVSRWMMEGVSPFARQWQELMVESARTALDTS